MQLFVNGPLWRNEVFIADDIQTDAKQQGFCYNGLRSCAAQGRAGADDQLQTHSGLKRDAAHSSRRGVPPAPALKLQVSVDCCLGNCPLCIGNGDPLL